jgi:hypothetical protein
MRLDGAAAGERGRERNAIERRLSYNIDKATGREDGSRQPTRENVGMKIMGG